MVVGAGRAGRCARAIGASRSRESCERSARERESGRTQAGERPRAARAQATTKTGAKPSSGAPVCPRAPHSRPAEVGASFDVVSFYMSDHCQIGSCNTFISPSSLVTAFFYYS